MLLFMGHIRSVTRFVRLSLEASLGLVGFPLFCRYVRCFELLEPRTHHVSNGIFNQTKQEHSGATFV